MKMYLQGRMSHHFREMKVGDYLSVKGPKVYLYHIVFVRRFCLFHVRTNTLYMLNLVLSHDTYFGLDFCFVYNTELLSIIRHHTCHSVVVHKDK